MWQPRMRDGPENMSRGMLIPYYHLPIPCELWLPVAGQSRALPGIARDRAGGHVLKSRSLKVRKVLSPVQHASWGGLFRL